MPERTITEQLVREAPEIEAFKLGLLQSGRDLANIPLQDQIPQQQVADLSSLEKQALAGAGTAGGIGGYRGLAQTGRGTLSGGLGVFNQGLNVLDATAGDFGQSAAAATSAAAKLAQAGGQFGIGPGYTAEQFGGGPGYTAERFGGGPGYTAEQFGGGPGYTAEGFDPATISRFQNPFEDQAVQQALADIRREGDIAANQQAAAAAQAQAFGGSRDILQREELGRNVLEQQARTAAQMRQAGYQDAAQRAQADFADQQRRAQAQAQFGTQTGLQAFEDAQRRAQAQAQFGTQSQQQAFEDEQRRAQAQAQFGTQTGLQAFEDAQRRAQAESQFGTQTGLQAFEQARQRDLAQAQQLQGIGSLYGNIGSLRSNVAGQYGSLGQAGSNVGVQQLQAAQQAQDQGLREIGLQQTLGGLERAQQQSALDAAFNRDRQQLYEPYTRLSWLSDIYKGAPSTQSSLGSVTSPSQPLPSVAQQIGGIGTGILGAAVGAKALGNLF